MSKRRMSDEDYMDKMQTAFMKTLDLSLVDGDDVMFRLTDMQPLTPRYRVEVGVVIKGAAFLIMNTKLNDPEKVGRDMASFINSHPVRSESFDGTGE